MDLNPQHDHNKPINLPESQQPNQNNGSYEVNLSAEFQDLQETPQHHKFQTNQNPYPQNEPQLKHYVIPGTMFEGQFQYITKQKKQQDVSEQLEQLQKENQQLLTSTQHYTNPTTFVQTQLHKAEQLQNKLQAQKQLNQNIKQPSQQKSFSQNLKPKIMQRVNLHQFNSNQVPELHQQDIPENLKPEEVKPNIYDDIKNPNFKSIKPLEPVKLQKEQLRSSNLPDLLPATLADPLKCASKQNKQDYKKIKSQNKEKHYIIPGTCFEGQFQYVSKDKKEEDVQRQLSQLDNEKRQLSINTQHYLNSTKVSQNKVSNIQNQNKSQFASGQNTQIQKKKNYQKGLQKDQNKQNQIQSTKTHKYTQSNRSQLAKTQFSQESNDTQSLKLLTKKCSDQQSIQMQIQSNQQGKVPYKIDQYTCMTVMSPESQQNSAISFPFSEEPNNDVEIIVLKTSFNKQATSPRDLVNQVPEDVLGSHKMQSIIQSMNNQDGSPVKVVVGTKQFANYPGQSAPSPAIIDETTLLDFRKKNKSQYLHQNQSNQERDTLHQNQSNQGWENPQQNYQSNYERETYLDIQSEEAGNPEEYQISTINLNQNILQKFNGKSQIQVEHLHATIDVENVRKVNQNGKKPKPILRKIVKSAVFSCLAGGLAWLSLENKKIAVISAATGFAVAFWIQK